MNKKDLKNLKQGDLIHLPSDVTLFKYAKSKKWGEIPFVKRTQITQRPYTTPFIGFNNNFKIDNLCDILYNGEVWSVDVGSIFPSGGQNG
tara:strand:- start:246 stop:515 length:270 start_codon:yes stop_codon:yes gene_type:complete